MAWIWTTSYRVVTFTMVLKFQLFSKRLSPLVFPAFHCLLSYCRHTISTLGHLTTATTLTFQDAKKRGYTVATQEWYLGNLATRCAHSWSTAAVVGFPAASNWKTRQVRQSRRENKKEKKGERSKGAVCIKTIPMFPTDLQLTNSPLCLRNRPQWKLHSSFRTQLPLTLILYSAPHRQHILLNAANT